MKKEYGVMHWAYASKIYESYNIEYNKQEDLMKNITFDSTTFDNLVLMHQMGLMQAIDIVEKAIQNRKNKEFVIE